MMSQIFLKNHLKELMIPIPIHRCGREIQPLNPVTKIIYTKSWKGGFQELEQNFNLLATPQGNLSDHLS